MRVRHQRLSSHFRNEILTWEHTGFSVDDSVRVLKGHRSRLQRLMRYMARPPISNERITYDQKTGQVLVRSTKQINGQRRVAANYDPLTFLSLLALQVPPKGSHTTRYYGWYSSRSRTKRRMGSEQVIKAKPEPEPPNAKPRRKRWAETLRQVFEVDPLTCPKYQGDMTILAFITTSQQSLIQTICDHLGEDTEEPRAHGPPA